MKDLECDEHEHVFPFLASNKILGQMCKQFVINNNNALY